MMPDAAAAAQSGWSRYNGKMFSSVNVPGNTSTVSMRPDRCAVVRCDHAVRAGSDVREPSDVRLALRLDGVCAGERPNEIVGYAALIVRYISAIVLEAK
jgi:hypothetical protein